MRSKDFQEFCGDPFFNKTLLAKSTWPHFTECFQSTVLVWVPAGFLWLSMPLYLYYMIRLQQGVFIPVNRFNTSKSFISIILSILAVVSIVQVESDAHEEDHEAYEVHYVAWGVKALTYLLAAIVVQVERLRGITTSGILWIYWFTNLLGHIIPFYSKIILHEYQYQHLSFVLFYVSFTLVFIQFILASFAEKLYNDDYFHIDKPSPELAASLPSRLTYWWITGLVILGYRKTLQESDVYQLHPRDQGNRVVPQFAKAWGKELAKAKDRLFKKCKEKFSNPSMKYSAKFDSMNNKSDETASLISGKGKGSFSSYNATDSDMKGRRRKDDKCEIDASIFKVLAKVYAFDLFKAHLCKFVYDLLQFVNPLLLTQLINYSHNLEWNRANGLEWQGYVFATSFFVASTLGSILFQYNFLIGGTLGMRMKSACIAAVYKKSLTISNEAKRNSTVGEIVNLMSVDCQRLQDSTGYLWMTWSAPLQIGLAMYMLWNVIGVATLAGLAVLVLLMPVNAFLSMKSRTYQVGQMKYKDERIKMMNEVLSGMKVLKLYAWEPSFEEKVDQIRKKELQILKKGAYLNAFSSFTWTCAPFVVTLTTFATYILISDGHYLDANKAFVALSLFNILKYPINMLPLMITMFVQAHVSVGRIGRFLRLEDLNQNNVDFDRNADNAIRVEGGDFTWDRYNARPTLSGINLDVPEGQLIAVVGQVGAGKSSLISAILGEMEKLKGHITIKSSVAYVPQQAWIQNHTLKDNILFGSHYNDKRYKKVIEDCALKDDLEILPGGDQTEIGEKGINLSGGQKQRVSLARAVYSNSEIYLLDDPLSAVDSHVGKHIFDKVISNTGSLKNKTRVLVTHGVHWLPMVDKIVVIVDGKISEIGSYDELLSRDGDFAQFLKMYLAQADSDDEDLDPEIADIKSKMSERVDSVTSDTSGDELARSRRMSRRASSMRKFSMSTKKELDRIIPKQGQRLIEDEVSATGMVKLSVFVSYIKAIGVFATLLFISFFAGYQGLNIFSSIWLSKWTSDDLLRNTTLSNTTEYANRNYMYLGIYAVLGVAQALSILCYALVITTRMVRAAGVMHKKMLSNIMRSPMSFFDTTPTGRILNRFSRDVDTIDNLLPDQIRQWMLVFFSALSIFVVISYSTPIFMVIIIPFAIIYYIIQRFYIPTARQLKRLESTTRSPIYSHFSETVSGASSIRAYKCQDRFTHTSQDLVDRNLRYYFCGQTSNRWLAVRLEFLGNLLVFAAALFVVVSRNVNDSLVGLSISYALQVTASLNWIVRMTSDLETNIVSIERVKEYSETPTEAAWVNHFQRPNRYWPTMGNIQFNNYDTRYREGLKLVLKGITCNIKGGEKIGIVGRTGAGKSSMTVALFRLIESAGGNITIDGININEIGLHDLRSRITILPQDPVLFSGSLRMNVDPTDEYNKDEIWTALKHAHLKEFAEEAGLTYECGEEGKNLSVGQRQLVCLARSLLRKTKILVLDEATAAVDMETDDLIQQSIRSEFSDCTVITIAHRLNTILDYDRIMVLDQGQIKEMDSPATLLNDKTSTFYGMAKDANLV